MSNTFWTADSHCNHARIIEYCNRPFTSVNEMNETIISNWNKVVKPGDTIYHLGDVFFCRGQRGQELAEQFLSRLNGKKILLVGNHDSKELINAKGWENVYFGIKELNFNGQHITMCHYAMLVYNRSHYGAWMLQAHSHNKLKSWIDLHLPNNKILDVGVDGHNFIPWSYEEIKQYMNTKKGESFGQFNIKRNNSFCFL
jgi:calcineurin-like phosphoesterase family protein